LLEYKHSIAATFQSRIFIMGIYIAPRRRTYDSFGLLFPILVGEASFDELRTGLGSNQLW